MPLEGTFLSRDQGWCMDPKGRDAPMVAPGANLRCTDEGGLVRWYTVLFLLAHGTDLPDCVTPFKCRRN